MIATPKTRRADLLFRVFSDRTRLRILNLLSSGEHCVCDLVKALRVPQPRASRHLAALRKAGLVLARKQGYWSYYRLAPPAGALHAKLLECLRLCSAEMPELLKDAKALHACRGKNCC